MRLAFKTTVQLILLMSLLSCGRSPASEEYAYTVLEKEVHDPRIFTQGFVLDGGWFYESSGHYGRSFIVRYPKSEGGLQEARLPLPETVFAEGITIVGDRLFLVSWKEETAWALDKNSFDILDTFGYDGEGWGLTHNGEHLILSDGSDILRFYSIDSFELQSTLKVRQGSEPVDQLNELEYHDGLVWANQWKSNRIYGINVQTGAVEATADLDELQEASATRSRSSVMNGIAYDSEHDAFWVTGKYWRHRYLVRFDSPE